MRAARWHARGDVRVEEVPEPELVPPAAETVQAPPPGRAHARTTA